MAASLLFLRQTRLLVLILSLMIVGQVSCNGLGLGLYGGYPAGIAYRPSYGHGLGYGLARPAYYGYPTYGRLGVHGLGYGRPAYGYLARPAYAAPLLARPYATRVVIKSTGYHG